MHYELCVEARGQLGELVFSFYHMRSGIKLGCGACHKDFYLLSHLYSSLLFKKHLFIYLQVRGDLYHHVEATGQSEGPSPGVELRSSGLAGKTLCPLPASHGHLCFSFATGSLR